jgi:hypothetical protein
MSIILSRRMRAFEALIKLALGDERARSPRSRHGVPKQPLKRSKKPGLALVKALIHRLRHR